MRKILTTLFLCFIGIISYPTLNAAPLMQNDCFLDFTICMTDAELEYTATIAVIEGSEEKAQQIYVAAVRACVSSHSDCPQQ